ncbi:MAG: thioesterase family protein [Propionibacteriaceae bacterium]|nr:thioesterase family protein [Propionibacteriaceae bacterium]
MRVEVPLRWADLDAQGHVNNARYVDYLQDARADFLYELGLADLLREGFAVVSNQIEYRAPVCFSPEPLAADITVAGLEPSTVTLAYELYQFERLVAVARTTLSAYDIAARTRRPLPETALGVFAPLVQPVEPLRDLVWADLNERAKVSSMRVRWSDIDAYGHVNNAMIFDYVQEGRITFTAAPLRGVNEQPETDYLWFLARQDVRYLQSVVLRKAPYIVRTGIAREGRTSLTFASQVDDPDTGTVCAQAAAVAVFADASGHPTPLTDALRADLHQYVLNP